MVKPVGSQVRLTYDHHAESEVGEGDILRTLTGRSYRIETIRVQERGKHAGRLHLVCTVLDPAEVGPDDVVHLIVWYPRRRRGT